MKALFITTPTSDCDNHFSAWESFAGPTERIIFNYTGEPIDDEIVLKAKDISPDVIFYIGAAKGRGVPVPQTFQKLRNIAKLINLCSDAIDPLWMDVIDDYRERDCFDFHVAIDGSKNAHVDMVTLTPVDPRPFSGAMDREIKCGFSGSVGPPHLHRYQSAHAAYRALVVNRLKLGGQITVRRRDPKGPYSDHIEFMNKCRILLNVSYCGSGSAQQVKGRVLEAGNAGCALLETAGSPTLDWFPESCLFLYEDPRHAVQIVVHATDQEISDKAAALSKIVREKYHPALIYGQILETAGLVDYPK